MPKPDGKLDESEVKKVIDWLESHQFESKTPQCPFCHTDEWGINEYLTNDTVFIPGKSIVVGAPFYPQVTVMCRNCGYTMFFNAIAMGIKLDSPKSDDLKEARNG
jgi:predicted nucleic-acid-binding Zn-ribbon protein